MKDYLKVEKYLVDENYELIEKQSILEIWMLMVIGTSNQLFNFSSFLFF
jgi:hypothetical protein